MSATWPEVLVADASLPATLERPELARAYVGRKVCKYFPAKVDDGEEPSLGGWYIGTVADVVIEDDTAYFQVKYDDDDDAEEMWWDDFRQFAVVYTASGAGALGAAAQGGPAEPDTAAWSSLPAKRKAVAPPSSQLPDDAARRFQGQAGGGRQHTADEGAHEDGRDAVRRRLNLEAADEAPNRNQHGRHGAARTGPRRTLGGPEPFNAGHLNRIQLTNFMNHENLEVKFNKYVTFVSGRNGSGKSALLQGLQACLGASARDTGRGSSLAAWVKKEKRTAMVTLEIWNTTGGEVEGQRWPPFRHEIYGSLIRIVRKITASEPDAHGNRTVTSSAYQLYRADGTEVKPAEMGQSAAKEVAALADHYNINASNPLIVITQDMARQFHQVTSGSGRCQKYDMYMQGTCLAATRDTLEKARANVLHARENMERQHTRLRQKRNEVKDLERQHEQLQRVDVYKQQLAKVCMAVMWTIVEEARANLNNTKQQAVAIPARIAALEAQVAEAESALAGLQNDEAALRDEMENTRPTELPDRLQQLNNRRQAAKRRRLDISRRIEETAARINDLNDRKASLDDELARLSSQRKSEELLRRVREHTDRVESKQAELARIQTAATQLEASRAAVAGRLADAQAALEERTRGLESARAAAREAREAHAELRAAAGGDGAQARAVNERTWGRDAMTLQAAVRAAPPGTFSQPPVGPLGMYLRRRADCDPALSRLLELSLRRLLDIWLVERREDSDALRALATQHRCRRPTILVSKFRSWLINYGPPPLTVAADGSRRVWRRPIDLVEPVEGLPPLIHTTIVDTLVDNGDAASVVFVDNRDEGHQFASGALRLVDDGGGQAGRRPRGAYDLNGAYYESKGGGAMIVTSQNNLPGRCRLAVDNSAQLAESERAVQARDAELQQAEAAHREAQAAVAAVKREQQEVQRQLMALSRDQARTQSQLDSLLQDTPTAVSEAQSQQVLNEIQKTQQELARVMALQPSLESERNNAVAEAQAISAEVEEIHKQSERHRARRQELLAQVNELAQRKQQAVEQRRAVSEQLQVAKGDLQGLQATIDNYQRNVEQVVAAAEEECTREEGLEAKEWLRALKTEELSTKYPNKTEAQRAAMLAQALSRKGLEIWSASLSQKIERAVEQAGGDLENITLKLQRARTDLNKLKGDVDAVSKKVVAIAEAHEKRKAKYNTLLKSVEQHSNSKFHFYMQRRGIIASLYLDHAREVLDLRVRKNHEREAATSLMQLSGGERSFTTAAFLIAMGEVLETPFRAMDEYDVYMDAGARKLATIALLECAWNCNSKSQLLLLSPQDTATLTEAFNNLKRSCERNPEGGIPPKDFVTIVHLRDPRGPRTG